VRHRSGLGKLLALVALATACEGRDVTVFQVGSGGTAGPSGSQPGGAGGSGSGAAGSAPIASGSGGAQAGSGGAQTGTVCDSNDDCPQGWFCEKSSCAAPSGLCDLRPTKTSLDYAPVCGCDGVTYWNDTARRDAGMQLFDSNQCSTTARPCNNGSDCGVMFASCARLVSRGEQCMPTSQGACWLLPPDCPDPQTDPDVWQECRPPMPGVPPPPCLDTCSAIRSEHPHQRPHDLKLCP
jgi:hypothetical protein